jgi:hypothetical protein
MNSKQANFLIFDESNYMFRLSKLIMKLFFEIKLTYSKKIINLPDSNEIKNIYFYSL